MVVSGDPPASFEGTVEVSSHQLQVRPDRGWLRTILSQSRNVLLNEEDTRRISVARLSRGGSRNKGTREGSRGTRRAPFGSSLEKTKKSEEDPPRGFSSLFFSTTARVHTCQYLYDPLHARRYYTRWWLSIFARSTRTHVSTHHVPHCRRL